MVFYVIFNFMVETVANTFRKSNQKEKFFSLYKLFAVFICANNNTGRLVNSFFDVKF